MPKLIWTLLCVALLLVTSEVVGQQTELSGVISDAETSETLIGATVQVGSVGVATDFDGKYRIVIPNGQQVVKVSYVGYDPKEIEISADGSPQSLNITLGGVQTIKEVLITADIAIDRKTPVAFSNIPTLKIEEELGGQEMVMMLNSTPGAYATQSGGGDGDARVTIRGFNQRNVAVMIDGIPVNDMENGWVYWSNWFGLGLVTQSTQVQRGLGASKLALPSVGGTINILTKGIDAKPGVRFKKDFGSGAYTRTTIGLTSGRLKKGWAISVAGSYKNASGWVPGNFSTGFFYYLRVDKQLGNHYLSASAYGAPQKHGQRSYREAIALYDTSFAKDLGIGSEYIAEQTYVDKGLKYNPHIGTLNGGLKNSRVNYYHKPQFSLRHSWQANPRLFLSNVAYLSIGNGGGAGPTGFGSTPEGFRDFQSAYSGNTTTTIFNPDMRSSAILRASVNNHFWYGLLSTVKYEVSQPLSITGGLDLRSYKGEHTREVYDLLGGNYYIGSRNARIDNQNTRLKEGDNFYYHNDGFVRWLGGFALAEYTKGKFSGFLNASLAQTSYAMEDYMWAKTFELNGETHFVSWDKPITIGETMYTVSNPNPDDVAAAAAAGLKVDKTTAQNQRVDWINLNSFTIKTGGSYNLSKQHNVFANLGYLSRVPLFSNVIDNLYLNSKGYGRYVEFDNIENEIVKAFELGYGFKSPSFSANVNSYYTLWENKALDNPPSQLEDPSDPDSDRIPINIAGIDAKHIGIELDFAYKPFRKWTFEGLASVGDWVWNSSETVILNEGTTDEQEFEFDAKGVHVGDAAQLQFGGLVKFEPTKRTYLKLKATHFGKHYSEFSPESLQGDNNGRDSWKLPNYTLWEFHGGCKVPLKKGSAGVRLSILNLLNATYLSDGTNNDPFADKQYGDFDAKSATVFFGQGRRFNLSLYFNL